jgi:hypothetical protein
MNPEWYQQYFTAKILTANDDTNSSICKPSGFSVFTVIGSPFYMTADDTAIIYV